MLFNVLVFSFCFISISNGFLSQKLGHKSPLYTRKSLTLASSSSSSPSESYRIQPGVRLIGDNDEINEKTPDFLAAVSYVGATAVEVTLIGFTLHVMQRLSKIFAGKFPEFAAMF